MSDVSTARDALIVELLSDVGRLHDDVKSIPKMLEISIRDSLDILADAVEDAEDTALSLQKSTKELILESASKAGLDIGIELTSAIHKSLERVFEPALNRAADRVDNLESRLKALSGNVRDTQATKFNYLILSGFIAVTVVMMAAMGWIAVKSQDVNETNKWFYNEYKSQRAVIDTLSPDVKKRFEK
jgi:hypothetical protein